MTRLVRTRGRLIAVLTILVASILLTWVASVVLGSGSGGNVKPGIDMTTPSVTPTPTPVATETATPTAPDTGAPAEAPAVPAPQPPAPPAPPV
ncbi:hypothetical protein [Actinomyces radicidentis]|nr:hypothetical protein [Actinomyces radicidentis]